MTKKKLITFKDYINSLKRLQKVAQELQDIDKDMGGTLSGMDASNSAKGELKTPWKVYINLTYRCWLKRTDTLMRRNSILRLRRCLPRTIISRKSNSFSSKNPNKIPSFFYGWELSIQNYSFSMLLPHINAHYTTI